MISPAQRMLLDADWTVDRIESSAITAVHLWFDREITLLPHAALVGRTSQWLFRHDRSRDPATTSKSGCRYQVVISASQHLADLPNAELLEQVLCDLRTALPTAALAQLLHHRVVTEPNAVFSVTPEGQRNRLPGKTGLPNVCLAGDWTDTGWPATMEGAILSGYNAAQAVLGNCELPLPVAELKPSWLARCLFGSGDTRSARRVPATSLGVRGFRESTERRLD